MRASTVPSAAAGITFGLNPADRVVTAYVFRSRGSISGNLEDSRSIAADSSPRLAGASTSYRTIPFACRARSMSLTGAVSRAGSRYSAIRAIARASRAGASLEEGRLPCPAVPRAESFSHTGPFSHMFSR